MAITNHERVGKAMELLKAGLGPFVEREFKNIFKQLASGRYQQAEFTADLWQVRLGQGTDEYKNPVEYFRRTYLTLRAKHRSWRSTRPHLRPPLDPRVASTRSPRFGLL
jgi:hypothetical protein